jgi:hypothetical protein
MKKPDGSDDINLGWRLKKILFLLCVKYNVIEYGTCCKLGVEANQKANK